jgi:hypothetical protein
VSLTITFENFQFTSAPNHGLGMIVSVASMTFGRHFAKFVSVIACVLDTLLPHCNWRVFSVSRNGPVREELGRMFLLATMDWGAICDAIRYEDHYNVGRECWDDEKG